MLDKILSFIADRIWEHGEVSFSGTFTIPSNGYLRLGSIPDPSRKLIVSAYVSSWTSNTGAFSLVGSGTDLYIAGTPGVKVSTINVRYLFKKY